MVARQIENEGAHPPEIRLELFDPERSSPRPAGPWLGKDEDVVAGDVLGETSSVWVAGVGRS
jgi:hypothetical protein